MLLRLLFPSWAFFDSVTHVPVLEARLHDGASTGGWREVLTAPSRSAAALLYNPEGTAHLALQSAVDRLAVECEHGGPHKVTHDIVAAMAESLVREWVTSGERATCWSWRVIAVASGHSDEPSHVLYESGEMAYAPRSSAC